MKTDAQKRASIKWDAENQKKYTLKLNKFYDRELIEWMQSRENKNGTMKEALEKMMMEEKEWKDTE